MSRLIFFLSSTKMPNIKEWKISLGGSYLTYLTLRTPPHIPHLTYPTSRTSPWVPHLKYPTSHTSPCILHATHQRSPPPKPLLMYLTSRTSPHIPHPTHQRSSPPKKEIWGFLSSEFSDVHFSLTLRAPLHAKIISFTSRVEKFPKKSRNNPDSINKVPLTSHQIYGQQY